MGDIVDDSVAEASVDANEAYLKFSHNVIEHLGIKLYKNKSGNVLAELLANSWDADAKNVDILLDDAGGDDVNGRILIVDDGIGMAYEHVQKHYLIVGQPKRKKPKEKSVGGRAPMGRKGLGKLAPFGIANMVDVVTVFNGLLTWFTLDLGEILKHGADGLYPPTFHAKNQPLSEAIASDDLYLTKKATEFCNKMVAGGGMAHGTLICMGGLSPNFFPTRAEVAMELGSRFTVLLLRPDFKVTVNGKQITEEESLPKFEFRIPKEGLQKEIIDGNEVEYWVGFVGTAEWSSDEAGVGVFAHGKIAQSRPYFFNKKGKEVFQRYLYAVVSADWIDEQENDLISTDRASIDWSDSNTKPLYDWGKKKVSEWITEYEFFRKKKQDDEVGNQAEQLRKEGVIYNYSGPENRQIENLVSDATREIGKSKAAQQARHELLIAVSRAWVNQPTRQLIGNLWTTLISTNASPSDFEDVVNELSHHSVPEAMGLAMTFSQRAYALTVLYELIHKKSETDLQKLVTSFPWILQPRGDLLTADVTLKTTIEKTAIALDETPALRIGMVIKGMSSKQRADLVFLTDPGKKSIQIIEIKKPTFTLDLETERQLTDYMQYTRQFHPSATITGVMIGKTHTSAEAKYDPESKHIQVKGWEEVLSECRSAYLELLVGMLHIADVQGTDSRIRLIKDIGGEEVWELLKKMAQKDDTLRELIEQITFAKAGDLF